MEGKIRSIRKNKVINSKKEERIRKAFKKGFKIKDSGISNNTYITEKKSTNKRKLKAKKKKKEGVNKIAYNPKTNKNQAQDRNKQQMSKIDEKDSNEELLDMISKNKFNTMKNDISKIRAISDVSMINPIKQKSKKKSVQRLITKKSKSFL